MAVAARRTNVESIPALTLPIGLRIDGRSRHWLWWRAGKCSVALPTRRLSWLIGSSTVSTGLGLGGSGASIAVVAWARNWGLSAVGASVVHDE